MFSRIRSLPYRFQLILASLQLSDSLPFSDVLSQEQIQSVCEKHNVSFENKDVYTPAVTLWGFLSQVIHKDEHRSCLAAVLRIGKLLITFSRTCCMDNCGAYCRARGELPQGVIEDLTTGVADSCEQECPADWLWYDRHVQLVDGTTVTMPDTKENQEKYPQQSVQQKGLGFPLARCLAILSLATGMLRGLALGAYQGKETGETSLLRSMMDKFSPGTIALLDKLFSNYWTICDFVQRHVDVVTLHNAARKLDLSQARRLGKNDYLLSWAIPCRPDWMDEETYALIPKTLTLRVIQAQITQRGFRVQSLTIITTLTDAETYPRADIVALYRQRWHVELDIRAIKVNMGMEDLRCRTPEMVEKEIWTCLLAYNLIRLKLLQAAKEKDVLPITLSFTFGLQTVAAGWMIGIVLNRETRKEMSVAELKSMSKRRVGNRPNRIEPRAIKRRPKPMRLLTMPRDEARALLLSGIDPYQKQR